MQGSPRIDELRQKFHENPRRYFAPLANEYRKAGDPEQAIAICRAHLAQQPGHMSGHVVYGQALYDARRPDEARTIFEKALELDPENAIVLRQLGDIAREKGESNEARHWYSKALDIDPQDSQLAAYIAELTEPLVGDAVETADRVEPAPAESASPALATSDEGAEAEAESIFVTTDAQVPLLDAPAEIRGPEEDEAAGAAVGDFETVLPEPSQDEEVPWRKTPRPEDSPFVTRTMAELYAKQGYREAALDVYRQLAIHHPEDADIRDRIAELSGIAGASPPESAQPAEPEMPQPAEPEIPQPADAGDFPPGFSEVILDTGSFGEPDDEPRFPASEDLNLPIEHDSRQREGQHFTEMALSDTGSFDRIELDSESPFGELAWEPELLAQEDLGSGASTEPPTPEMVTGPVALGEFQTSIDEAGAAASSSDDESFPPAEEAAAFEGTESVADAGTTDETAEALAWEDEAAAAMVQPTLPETAEDTGEHAVVAYSPELPRGEDLPHFTPKVPTIREFFTTLGARKPPSSEAGQHITARAAIPGEGAPPSAPQLEELPLATDAFGAMFGDEPVAEDDTRAAFALSGALSGTGHNPTPTSLRTSPPLPSPAVEEPDTQTQESEDDIRRFREWLDGLADT